MSGAGRPDTGSHDQRPDRRLFILSALVAGCYGVGLLGLALLPLLLRDHPLVLIALNPTTSVLLLASARVGAAPLIALTTARRFAFHVVSFLLGRWYSGAAVRWMEQRSGRAVRMVGVVERLFARVGWLVMLVWPGPLPSVLAGSGRWAVPLFVVIDLIGTATGVALTRAAAVAAADPLALVLRFTDQNADWLTVVFVVVATLWLALRWWRGRGGKRDDAWASPGTVTSIDNATSSATKSATSIEGKDQGD